MQVGDVYDESATPNDIFIEGVDFSICQSDRDYWATHQQTDVTDIVDKVQGLFAVQNGATKLPNSNNPGTFSKTNAQCIKGQVIWSSDRDWILKVAYKFAPSPLQISFSPR